MDNTPLSNEEKMELCVLFEEQEYFLNQHKNHIESVSNKDLELLENVEEKYKMIELLENKAKELKENTSQFKDKLSDDIKNSYLKDNKKDDLTKS